jgi:TonB family protein
MLRIICAVLPVALIAYRWYVSSYAGNALPWTGLTTAPGSMAYFRGAWTCTTKVGSTVTKAFGFNDRRTAYVSRNAFVAPDGGVHSSTETYVADGGRIAVRARGFSDFTGTSSGWSGDDLRFVGTETRGTSRAGVEMRYTRTDADHYRRTFAPVESGDDDADAFSVESCARAPVRRADAYVIAAAEPAVPALAAQQGVYGVVRIAVSLDEHSRLTDARVLSTASPVLNAPALAAARATTYQTRIRNGKPIPGTYVFVVDFRHGR